MSERRYSSRRTEAEEDDRRKIPRFTDNELNRSLNQTRIWLRLLFAISIIATVFEIAWSIQKDLGNITQGFFFGVITIIFAVIVWRAMYLINTFLDNHSISNLKRVHEQFALIFTYFAVMAVVFYITSFLYRA